MKRKAFYRGSVCIIMVGGMKGKASRHQRLIPFPAFSYAFIQRGVHHTRTLATWALLQKARLEVLQRRQVVAIICKRMGLSPKQARCIIRQGDRRFWTVVNGMVYPHTSAQVALLIRHHHLARVIKRSKMYVPEQALRNLGQLRAHLSLAVISRSPGQPTPRAYSAKCLSRSRNTISTYRSWLREAGFITTTSIYTRIGHVPREDTPRLRRGHSRACGGLFTSSDGRWLFKRGPDIVEINPANIYRVDRGQSPSEGIVELQGFKYKKMILPAPVSLPRPPPGRSRADREWSRQLRQENRIIAPRIPLLLRSEGVIIARRGE